MVELRKAIAGDGVPEPGYWSDMAQKPESFRRWIF